MKHLASSIALFALSACSHVASTESAPVPIPVHCVPASRRELQDARTLRGSVAAAPDRDAIVSAQVPGRLLSVAVREGDVVSAGQTLAVVETRPLLDVRRTAEASLAQARAAQAAARALATREEHLVERGISPQQSLETARASLGVATGAVAAAEAQVDLARQGIARGTVRAPIDGVVVRLLRRAGEVVDGTPATPILEIADPAFLELAASASPADLVALRMGQSASVTFEALPEHRFEAVVRTVSPSIDPGTGVGAVHLTLAPGDVLPPFGLMGQALVIVGDPRSAVVVPAASVRSAGGERVEVVVCEGGHAHVTPIEAGERLDDLVEVTTGLDVGARVVVDEVAGLADGASIAEAP